MADDPFQILKTTDACPGKPDGSVAAETGKNMAADAYDWKGFDKQILGSKNSTDAQNILYFPSTAEARQQRQDVTGQTLQSDLIGKGITTGDSTLMAMALGQGDEKLFGSALKGLAKDPEKLHDTTEKLNEILEKRGSDVRLHMTDEGKLLVSDKSDHALSYDPKTGRSQVKAVWHNDDGTISLVNGEHVVGDTGKIFAKINDNITQNVIDDLRVEYMNSKLGELHPQVGAADAITGKTGASTGEFSGSRR